MNSAGGMRGRLERLERLEQTGRDPQLDRIRRLTDAELAAELAALAAERAAIEALMTPEEVAELRREAEERSGFPGALSTGPCSPRDA